MKKYNTEQEKFWAGNFGNEYISRNASDKLLSSNLAIFSKIFRSIDNIESVIEYGPNVGLNLRAINMLFPDIQLSGVEINENAIKELSKIKNIESFHESVLDFKTNKQWDFVFTKGVLIHIAPDDLSKIYNILYKTSRKWICLIEYYNPTPIEIEYRGHSEKLYKRDFCSDLRNKYPDLKLIDYGFVYHRDPVSPQDDLTWFLLSKD
jgi:pseudaminic acid biosynthesis-associated methylase